jgi:PAS domain S-box-containing protein
MKEQPGIAESAMRSSGFLPRLAAGLLVLNLGVVALAGWSIRQNFQTHEEQAELATQNLARALENDLVGTIRTHEMALHAVLDELYRQRAAGRVDADALNAYIERVRGRLPGVDAIRVTDAQGVLLYGSGVQPEQHKSLADRPHFIRLRDDPGATLAFSKPQVSRVNDKWVQVLAHRIQRPDGEFDGMVFVAIPLAHLSHTFSVLDIGEHGIVALRDMEFNLVARYPESAQPGLTIGSPPPTPELAQRVTAGKLAGSYISLSGVDRVERMISFRKVADYPFYVQVGWARDDYLAATRNEAKKLVLFVAMFMLITLAAGWVVYSSWRRQRRINRALAESETRLNGLFENMSSGVAIYRVEEDGRRFVLRGFNRAAERIEQRPRSEVVGRDVVEAFPGIGELGLLEVFRRVWQSGKSERFPVSFYRDGRIAGWRDNFVYKLPGGEIVAIYDDVTERMLAQQSLEELNRDFVTLLESTSDFIYFKDRDSRIRFCSQSMAKITGHASWRDMVGKHDLEVFPPETAKIYFEEELPVFRDGVPLLNKTDPYLDADGNRCWVNTSKWPVFAADGRTVIGLFGISRDITARVRAEDALRLSEARYRTTFDHAAVGIAQVAIDGRFMEINQVFCDVIGYSREEVLSQGFTFQQITQAEDLEADLEQVGRLLDGEDDQYAMEKRYIRKDGGVVWVNLSVALLRDEAGDPLHFISSVADITERKQAEQAVRISMEKLNEAQRIAQVGNWELDLVDGHLYWSDEIFNLFEIDKARFDASYEAFLNAIHPDDRNKVNQAYTRSLETREPYEISHRLLMEDGRIKWVNERCETFYDGQGKALRSVGTVQDVTERKLIEDALRQSEAYNKLLFSDSRVAMVVADAATGRYIDCNQAAVEIYEMPEREAVLGLTPMDVSDATQYDGEDSASAARSRIEQALQQGAAMFEWRHRRPSGKVWDGRVNLMRLQQGDRTYLLFTLEDITEQKRIGEELRSKTDALQRSNADLERFAYSVSHDMRQPLRAVSGHLQLLQRSMKDKLDDDERENMNFALDGAKRMDSMIVSLLDYSRVGRKTEAKAWMQSRDALEDALGFLEPMVRDSAADVSVSGEWPQVYASRDEMVRLFQNLVGNALHYHEKDQPPRVEVESGVDGGTWRVTVRDHGIGIDPSQLDRLFQFFSRLQSRARFDGTGMGLALCRRIVEHHGGRIRAESGGEGRGSTFVFELPLNVAEEGADHA